MRYIFIAFVIAFLFAPHHVRPWIVIGGVIAWLASGACGQRASGPRCSRCGQVNRHVAQYCGHCGQQL